MNQIETLTQQAELYKAMLQSAAELRDYNSALSASQHLVEIFEKLKQETEK